MADPARRAQAVAAARELLEAEGEAALTMRRLAERMGMRAPSLYKHLPDKADVEVELTAQGLQELTDAVAGAAPGGLQALATTYRAWALAHPHLYLLMTQRPLPRDRLPRGLEDRAGDLLRDAVRGDEDLARALWAAAHGMVVLELAERFPPDADLDRAWTALVAAFGQAPRAAAD